MRNHIAVATILGALVTYATWSIMSAETSAPTDKSVIFADISADEIVSEEQIPASDITVETGSETAIEGELPGVDVETVGENVEDAPAEEIVTVEPHDQH